MKVLVTGGAGFVGSNFVHYALQHHPDWEITNLDKLTYAGNPDNLKDLQALGYHKLVKGDITDEQLVDSIVGQGVELIVHFAAETHVDRSFITPGVFVDTNIRGTYTLLEAGRKHGIKRFVQISTPEVYGTSAPGKAPFKEDDPVLPTNPYAASKAGADLLCRAYAHSYGANIVSTRFANAYGPYQLPEKLLPLLITHAIKGQPIPIYGDGHYRRNWIHVHDICRAIDMILDKGKAGQAYNIDSPFEMSNVDFVSKVLALMGKSQELMVFVPDRPAHDWQYPLDGAKIRREIGWRLEVDLDRGLAETIAWYENNVWWWERFKPPDFGALFGGIVKGPKQR